MPDQSQGRGLRKSKPPLVILPVTGERVNPKKELSDLNDWEKLPDRLMDHSLAGDDVRPHAAEAILALIDRVRELEKELLDLRNKLIPEIDGITDAVMKGTQNGFSLAHEETECDRIWNAAIRRAADETCHPNAEPGAYGSPVRAALADRNRILALLRPCDERNPT